MAPSEQGRVALQERMPSILYDTEAADAACTEFTVVSVINTQLIQFKGFIAGYQRFASSFPSSG